jgi:hypothetical protein
MIRCRGYLQVPQNFQNTNNMSELFKDPKPTSHAPLSGVVESQKHKCGQCGKYFESEEAVYSHSHVNDIASEMRDNGDSDEDIESFVNGSREMGW